jgi:putative transposase
VGCYARVKRVAVTVLMLLRQRRVGLEVKITQAHAESRVTYGSLGITAELRDQGEVVTAKAVAKIMASIGLEGISPRTFTVTTTVVDPTASFPVGSGRPTLRPRPARCGLADRHPVSDVW